MGELSSNYQGGVEYDYNQYSKAKAMWMEETNGKVPFWEWYDYDVDPAEPGEEEDE